MSGRKQPVHNRGDNVVMGGEQFAAAAEILIPTLSFGATSEPTLCRDRFDL